MDEDIIYGVARYENINAVTCYMNSILGILQQTPQFTDYLLSDELRDILISKFSKENLEKTVVFNLLKLFYISLTNDNKIIRPTSFRKAISEKDFIWGENQHQDSQEFLNFLITNIEEEIYINKIFIPGRKGFNHTSNKNFNYNIENILSIINWNKFMTNEISPIKQLFTGLQKTEIKCSLCSNISSNFEIYQMLSLSIPIINKMTDLNKQFKLEDLINIYLDEEKLDKNNMSKCEFCYIKNRQIKQTKLWKTPQILIIQIKRFLMNDYGIMSQKLNNLITYPIRNLDMSIYIDDKSPYKNNSKYNLYGINCHHSLGNFNTINFGHYTSIVKSRNNNCWYHYDDNKPVKKIRSDNDLINNNAYLLFYYKI
jgi:ubiquitin C-terminal hydrolase